jgi:NDP-sugar pyrophosphorylase family protein
MVIQGEIPSGVQPDCVDDFFVEVDKDTGRAFYVPTKINVYHPRRGGRIVGTFLLDQNTGAVIEETANVSPVAQIGHRVIIAAGTRISSEEGRPTVIGDDTLIEDKVSIYPGVNVEPRAAIFRRATIQRDSQVGARATIGARALLRPGTQVEPGGVVFASETTRAGSVIQSSYREPLSRIPR